MLSTARCSSCCPCTCALTPMRCTPCGCTSYPSSPSRCSDANGPVSLPTAFRGLDDACAIVCQCCCLCCVPWLACRRKHVFFTLGTAHASTTHRKSNHLGPCRCGRRPPAPCEDTVQATPNVMQIPHLISSASVPRVREDYYTGGRDYTHLSD